MDHQARRRPPNSIWHVGKFGIIFTILVPVWLFSGFFFMSLGLPSQTTRAFRFAEWAGISAAVCMLIIVLIAMRTVIRSWGDVCLREVANVARYPMRLVECLRLPKAGA